MVKIETNIHEQHQQPPFCCRIINLIILTQRVIRDKILKSWKIFQVTNWNIQLLLYITHDNSKARHSVYLSFSLSPLAAIHTIIQGDSFGTRPKKMRISQRLFITFWTCIYYYIPCFMRSMSILVCRSLTSWHHRDNDWRLAPCRAQPCHCAVR